jgi:hypothetical protein
MPSRIASPNGVVRHATPCSCSPIIPTIGALAAALGLAAAERADAARDELAGELDARLEQLVELLGVAAGVRVAHEGRDGRLDQGGSAGGPPSSWTSSTKVAHLRMERLMCVSVVSGGGIRA